MPVDKSLQIKMVDEMEFPTVNTGMYIAEITDIEDLGEKETRFGTNHLLDFKFLVMADEEVELTKWVTAKWSPGGQYQPSNLYLICTACGFDELPEDLNDLIGEKLMISVKLEKDEEGNKRNKITDFAPMEKDEGQG